MTIVFIEIEEYKYRDSDKKVKTALRVDEIVFFRQMDGGTRIVLRSGGIFDTAMSYEKVKNLITTACKD